MGLNVYGWLQGLHLGSSFVVWLVSLREDRWLEEENGARRVNLREKEDLWSRFGAAHLVPGKWASGRRPRTG